jgi:hypothetical protein
MLRERQATMSATSSALKRADAKLTREQLRQLMEIERQNYCTGQLVDKSDRYPLFSG